MSAKQIDLVQGTKAWLAWRKSGIGASDVAALFGKSPYKTERDLWFEKAGLGEPDDEDRSYIFQKGHEIEAELRNMFADHCKIEIKPTCFENGIFLCSLDGYNKDLGILEAKYVGRDAMAKIVQGELPEHHRIQVQAQLYGSESDKAYYGAKAPETKGGHVVEVGRDEKLIKQIVEAGERFWSSIGKGQVPALSPQDTLFITDPAQKALFERLCDLKAKKDQLESEYEEVDKAVRALATHPKVRCLGVSITEVERAGSVDYLRIPEVKALAEEYIESFRKKSSKYKTIRFVEGA